ncbi:AMP-binding protein [Paraburkholderia caballeronis]|uniref:Acetyl-CoA synthetase n=1 Tax=Paraburkholderia caballeronis TaxID=416943 RepID=A0A1H7QEV1_9BURK|nr:AMP-binding protein [Paraburkholderia caballeronis]PXW22598.1 acetyl-CoA synthetase [Paraburkholderia caballeronis]PXW96469.1 acetyl-CoA synthetase [Paraburkholderia caballeronis]RAJ92880.1 acetyl-CoA synthetase [Paraburkholderia caballeronis]SEE08209.1 acetyl-CoA synthetase [Paraburkholderia caballeronis]SEL46436.1 acetyl-CoA synthetase [Paraburkholderia caballeronis]
MTRNTRSAQAFLDARDLLLRHRTDYERAYREFEWPKLDTFNWALDYFDVIARGNDNPALWIVDDPAGGGTRLSFAQMAERSSRMANFLREHGVARGDRLLLMLPNRVELWDVMLAAMKLGAVVLPATTQLSPDDVRERVEAGGARFVVVDAAELAKFDALDASVKRIAVGARPDEAEGWIDLGRAYGASASFEPDGPTNATDPLLLYFTSGTTSKPKLVEHTHESYPVGHLSTMYWVGLQPGDVHWNISSPGWAKHAWSCFFAPWNAQACVFVYNYARFVPKDTLTALVQCGVTTLCAPPTVWRMLVQEPLASYPVKLREIVGAGEPLNPEIIERVRHAWGITIRDGYGQTETTCQIGNSPGQPVVAGSMGRPLPGYRVELVDADDQPVAEGEIALPLAHRPLGLMTGYANNAKATEYAMRNGYYHTSDVALRRDDGYYVYVGRADDVFKSSDYRLSPFELESVLIEHEAIAEAAVVPSADALRLSVPKAFVTVRQGYEIGPELARAVFRFSREKLAPYKRIRRLQFSDLPKTISGKIRRVELRRREMERGAEPARLPGEYWEEDFPDLR